jgi:hypothetical protein
MNAINVASLINPLGYTMGITLYAMLLALVLRHPIQAGGPPNSSLTGAYHRLPVNGLMLATGHIGDALEYRCISYLWLERIPFIWD